MPLKSVAERMDRLVDRADNAYGHDASRTQDEADAGVAVAFERGDGSFVGINVHGFDYQQIIIQGNDRIDQCYEYQYMKTRLEGGHEYEELAEKPGERRDAR